ncbi:MAG: glycine cleavage system aminomethyltransferase GcvT [Nocardiopsaceae bacterium]|nr:glycine cleavage system aminomethyltransferase GcvT [Nocardiopsaceae bacterium]
MESKDTRDTPLRAVHERLGATMTDFAGWLMPLRYGSETAEHNAVRSDAALFDLSHMGEIAVTGPDAGAALDYALVGWLSRLAPGRARYTMLCAPDGGVLDDLVVYRQAEDRYLVVANASNTEVVLRELNERVTSAPGAGRGCTVADETADTGLIAVQGPNGSSRLAPLTSLDLSGIKYYAGAYGSVAGRRAWVARTGYTGEDGFEIFCAPQDAEHIWEALSDSSSLPAAGLASRDTLRLEAGMPLYGNELGPDVTPYEAGVGRIVKLDKPGDFVGREALAARAAEGPRSSLIGLVASSRRVPRHGYAVLSGDGTQVGTVTSGAPSPTLGAPIAMAYVAPRAEGPFGIDVRGKTEPASVTELPFYHRKGK